MGLRVHRGGTSSVCTFCSFAWWVERFLVHLQRLKCVILWQDKQGKPSGTGIYHVMLRGINRQNIFEDEEDYRRFLMIAESKTEEKNVMVKVVVNLINQKNN